MSIYLLILIVSAAAFVINMVFIPVLLNLSHRFRWYDTINHRKIHTGDMPHIGGVGIVSSLIIALFLYFFLEPYLVRGAEITPVVRFIPLVSALLLIHITGLIDDFAVIRARYKLLAQFAAACIVVFSGYVVTQIRIPFSEFTLELGLLGYPVTILWIVGICNAMNLTDGMDGLAGGISAIGFAFMGIIGLTLGTWSTAAIGFVLFGSTMGFLVFNSPPAKIFMGDSGALSLGFILATVMLVEIYPRNSGTALVVSLALTALPLAETAASIFRRLKRRSPIYSPDKQHTHHKLLDFGMSTRRILAILYGFCMLHGASVTAYVILEKPIFLLLIGVVWVLTFLFFIVLDRIYNIRFRNESAI